MQFRSIRVALLGASLALGAALLGGCAALGPMAATTGMASIPAGRPSIEGSLGFVPGYYLSAGVQAEPKGASIGQGAILVEPGRFIVPGLVLGGRYVGSAESGGYPEPMVGYRTYVGDNHLLAVSAVGYATHGSGSRNGAAYSATRGGGEAGIDFRVTPEYEWFEMHLSAGASLTGISARGNYCVDGDRRYGVDCPNPPDVGMNAMGGGLYPSGVAAVTVDIGRRLSGAFHGGRVALIGGGGTMPRVVAGKQESAEPYAQGGLTITVGFGEAR